WPTVSGINVIPATILTRNRGQLFEWIDNAGRSRAGDSDNTTRQQSGFTIARDRFSQRIRDDVKTIISGNLAHAFATDTKQVRALIDRVVTLFRCIDDQIGRRPAQTSIFDLRSHTVAR